MADNDGQPREYVPDFVVRLAGAEERYLIAEVKGADWENLAEVKKAAAERCCAAVNATGELVTGIICWRIRWRTSSGGSMPARR